MSNYAFMSAAKYEELKASLTLGARPSLNASEYVAKLKPGQTPEGTEIKTHKEALEITQSPAWVKDNN